jgi:uncharacterized protein YegL
VSVNRVLILAECKAESDIVLLVDTSSLMGEENFGKVKVFLTTMVDKLALYSGQSRVAIVTFSGEPKVSGWMEH